MLAIAPQSLRRSNRSRTRALSVAVLALGGRSGNLTVADAKFSNKPVTCCSVCCSANHRRWSATPCARQRPVRSLAASAV